jgi:adenylosuccinate synthase
VTEIALTLVDVLDAFDEVRVCTSYQLNELQIDYLPAREDLLAQVTPSFTSAAGWRQDITGARRRADLPEGALAYIALLEREVGARITMVGVGPDREQLVPVSDEAAILAVA